MKQGELIDSRELTQVYEGNLATIKACKKHVKSYLKALYEIKETQCYMVRYVSFKAFLEVECPEVNERTVQKFIAAESVRRNLVKEKRITKSQEVKQSHLEPLSPMTPKQQSKIFSDVVDKAKTEKRAPTASDFRKAAKAVADKKQAKADAAAGRTPKQEEKEDGEESKVIDGKVVGKIDPVLEGYIIKGEPYCCPTCDGTGSIVPDKEVMLELSTPEFFVAWSQWMVYRKKRKLPKYGMPQKLLKKLAAMGHDIAVHAIDLAITQNWNGVHEKEKMEKQEKKPAQWGEFLDV